MEIVAASAVVLAAAPNAVDIVLATVDVAAAAAGDVVVRSLTKVGPRFQVELRVKAPRDLSLLNWKRCWAC